jgi:hypothetical protein
MSSARPSSRSLISAAALLVAACSTPPAAPSAAPAIEPPSSTPAPSAAPSPTASPSPSVAATASAGDAWLIVSRPGDPALRVMLDSTLEDDYELPVGVPDATWGQILTATPGERTTRIQDLVV